MKKILLDQIAEEQKYLLSNQHSSVLNQIKQKYKREREKKMKENEKHNHKNMTPWLIIKSMPAEMTILWLIVLCDRNKKN